MQKRNKTVRSTLKATYTTTNAWAEVYGVAVGDFRCVATESGWHDIKLHLGCISNNTAGDSTYIRISINGIAYPSASKTGAIVVDTFYHDEIWDVWINAGEIVKVEAIYGGSSTLIEYAAGTKESSLCIRNNG